MIRNNCTTAIGVSPGYVTTPLPHSLETQSSKATYDLSGPENREARHLLSGLDLDSLNTNDFGGVVRIVIFRQVIQAQ
jgi:hypothetical protein